MKAGRIDKENLFIECPGCGNAHRLRIKQGTGDSKSEPCWGFDDDFEKPTFTPSLLCASPGRRCHSFITNGKIRFLDDCDHALAGRIVELPEID